MAFFALLIRLMRICSTLCLSTRTRAAGDSSRGDGDAVALERRHLDAQRVLDELRQVALLR